MYRKKGFYILFLSINFLLFFSSSVFSQFINVELEIKSGNQPLDINWNLYNNQTNLLLLTDDGQINRENEYYDWEFLGSCQDCYRLELQGLDADVEYSIRIDGKWYIHLAKGYNETIVHYIGSCNVGENCENPEIITLNSQLQNRTIQRMDHWYKINANADVFLTVNTCQNQPVDTKLWLYSRCPEDPQEGPEGALAFNDESSGCIESAELKDVVLTEGNEYWIRVGIRNAENIEKLEVNFVFEDELFGCIDPTSCNFNPFANVDDGSCTYETDCGPDLWVNDTLLLNSLYLDSIMVLDSCLYEEQCVSGFGLRQLVRFSTEIHNLGTADYIIGDPTDNPVGFSEDNCHDHWHQLSYTEYLLYDDTGQLVPYGLKNGFCVLDLDCVDNAFPKYACNYMGITAGCHDIYESSLNCQWVDVTDLDDGNYTLIVRINWLRLPDLLGKHELDYDNNAAQACINLDRSSGELIMTVLENCETYTDCLGIPNGSATVDCKGICGGVAHLGDLDDDGSVDDLDIEAYFEFFQDQMTFPAECFDLNRDEVVDISDVILLHECLINKNENDLIHGHNHCFGAYGSVYSNDTVWINIVNYDAASHHFDIEYKSPHTEISAFRIGLKGADLRDADFNFSLEEFYSAINSDSLSFLGQSEKYKRSVEYAPLLSMSVSEFEDTLSLNNMLFFDSDFKKMTVVIGDATLINMTTSLQDIESNPISIFPNPVVSFINIEGQDLTGLESFEINDLKGKRIRHEKLDLPSRIDLSQIPEGCYFLTLNFLSGRKENFKIVVLK